MTSNSSSSGGGDPSGNINGYPLSGKVILSVLLIFIVVLTAYIMLQCLNRCILGRDVVAPLGIRYNASLNSVRRSNQTPQQVIRSGLHPSVVAALPLVAYQKGSKDEPVECAVCLGQLAEGEKVRMLPRCKHVFHVDCIDMWLFSHSTCPVCRANAEPPGSLRSPGSLAVVMAGLANAKEAGSTSGPAASFRRIMSRDFSGRSAHHSTDEAGQDLERQ